MASKTIQKLATARQLTPRTIDAKPIYSTDEKEAKARVVKVYKSWIRYQPDMHFTYPLEFTLAETRLGVKKQFQRYSHIKDPRAIDLLCHRAEEELHNAKMIYTQSCHLASYLFQDSVMPKPPKEDFLANFFAGKN